MVPLCIRQTAASASEIRFPVLALHALRNMLVFPAMLLSLATGAPILAGENGINAVSFHVALARGGLSEAQPLLLRLTQPLTMNQYHMLIFTPSAGWQDDMPCLRPPESFRAMMPVLRPQGVLGTNRAVLIPPEVSIVRVR